jgi:hypothetical protein
MNLEPEWILSASVALLGLVSLPLVVRSLLEIGRRHSEPGRAIASAAVVLGSLGMCGLVWAPEAGDAGWVLLLFSLLMLKTGSGLMVIFTWRMFRGDSVPARALAMALLATQFVSLVLDFDTARYGVFYPEDSVGFRFGQLATSLPFLWLGVECIKQHRQHGLDLSAQFGVNWLSDQHLPAWGIGSMALAAECVIALIASLSTSVQLQSGLVVARGGLYIVVAACVVVAFYMPVLGRGRIEVSAPPVSDAPS